MLTWNVAIVVTSVILGIYLYAIWYFTRIKKD